MLVREEFETEDQAIDCEKARLRSIGKMKHHFLQASGVAVEQIHLSFDCGIVYNPPELGEESVWALDYFKEQILDFVADDAELVARLLHHQEAVHGLASTYRTVESSTSCANYNRAVCGVCSLQSASSSEAGQRNVEVRALLTDAAGPSWEHSRAQSHGSLAATRLQRAWRHRQLGDYRSPPDSHAATQLIVAATRNVVTLESAGFFRQASEEMARAMLRCKRLHDVQIRWDAASRLQSLARRRAQTKASARAAAATRIQALTREKDGRRLTLGKEEPVVRLGACWPSEVGDPIILRFDVVHGSHHSCVDPLFEFTLPPVTRSILEPPTRIKRDSGSFVS